MRISPSGETPEAQNFRERSYVSSTGATESSMPPILRATSEKYKNYTDNVKRYSKEAQHHFTLRRAGGMEGPDEMTGTVTNVDIFTRKKFSGPEMRRSPQIVVHLHKRVTKQD